MGRDGLSEHDWTVWREMEALHKSGVVHHIGASNLNIKQLNELITVGQRYGRHFYRIVVMPAPIGTEKYARRATVQASHTKVFLCLRPTDSN